MEDYDEDYDSDVRYSNTRPGYQRNARSSYHRVYHDRDPYEIRSGDGGGLHRARSSGHGPMPNIHIHNRMTQDQDNIDDNRGRDGLMPGAFPRHLGRSRSRSAANADDLDYQRQKWRLEQKEADAEARQNADAAVNDFRRDMENREREREALLRQAKIDEELRESERKEFIRQAIQDEEAKKRKASEDRKAMLRQARQEEEDAKNKEKQEREEMMLRIKVEEEERKQKDKLAWEAHERRKLEMEKKEKDEKEKKDKEYLERVTKDFTRFGFTESQIERAVKYEEEKKKKGGVLVVGDPVVRSRSRSALGGRPVYPKIHRLDIAVETLKSFDLDYEYDRNNKDYIIIMHELTEEQTDQLFEHTRQLKVRSPRLLEDGRGRKDNDYVWIKKRGTSRGKSRDRSRGGFRERFAENLVRRM